MIVVMKLTAPSNDDVMRKIKPINQSVWPLKIGLCPGPVSENAANGVYEVQPLLAAPPGTKKLMNIIRQNPKKRNTRPQRPYWIPITLWSVEKIYFRHHPSSWCSCSAACACG